MHYSLAFELLITVLGNDRVMRQKRLDVNHPFRDSFTHDGEAPWERIHGFFRREPTFTEASDWRLL